MTLNDAKDQIATQHYAYNLKRYFTDFEDMKQYLSYNGQWPTLLGRSDEAAELYAKINYEAVIKQMKAEYGLLTEQTHSTRFNSEFLKGYNSAISDLALIIKDLKQ